MRTSGRFAAIAVCTLLSLCAVAFAAGFAQSAESVPSRIYKCVNQPDGGLICSTVVWSQAFDADRDGVAEVALAQKVAQVAVRTLPGLISSDSPVELCANTHGASACCRRIGGYGNTSYIECEN